MLVPVALLLEPLIRSVCTKFTCCESGRVQEPRFPLGCGQILSDEGVASISSLSAAIWSQIPWQWSALSSEWWLKYCVRHQQALSAVLGLLLCWSKVRTDWLHSCRGTQSWHTILEMKSTGRNNLRWVYENKRSSCMCDSNRTVALQIRRKILGKQGSVSGKATWLESTRLERTIMKGRVAMSDFSLAQRQINRNCEKKKNAPVKTYENREQVPKSCAHKQQLVSKQALSLDRWGCEQWNQVHLSFQ